MSWQILILISVLADSLGSIFQKIAMKKHHVSEELSMILFQSSGFAIFFCYCLIFHKFNWSAEFALLNTKLVLHYLFSGLLYCVSSFTIFLALKRIDVGIYRILFSSRALVSVLLATFFLNESLNGWQLFGGILLIISILNLFKSKLKKLKHLNSGYFFALLAALCFGIAVVNDKTIIAVNNIYFYLIFGWSLPAIFISILRFPKVRKDLQDSHINSQYLLDLGKFIIFYVISSSTFYEALIRSNNTSIISAINQSSIIFTIIFAFFILKERQELMTKFISLLFTISGLLLLTLPIR
ncbi:MAG: EamA family transporter [bacterium]